jgi:ABC-2 type transport system ATP-binding protein
MTSSRENCSMNDTPAIQTRGLSRRYGDFTAVKSLDLAVDPGSIFGFVGPNGAGKTTTISMLTGLLEPTAGSVFLCGRELTPNAVDVKRLMGYVADQPALFEYLRPAEYLTLVGRVYGLRDEVLRTRVDELIDVLDLREVLDRTASQCSHGMRKRIAFAGAVIHNPAVLFLDEPFEGMDALTVRIVLRNLKAMAAGGTAIFLTSHILDIVERTCDRIAIINGGGIVWDSPASEIRSRVFEQMEEQRASALERILLELVGSSKPESVLSWLKETEEPKR